MTNQDVINYVRETPHNMNPAILNQYLNQLKEDAWDIIIEHNDSTMGDIQKKYITPISKEKLTKAYSKMERGEFVNILYCQNIDNGTWKKQLRVHLNAVDAFQGEVYAYGQTAMDIEGVLTVYITFTFDKEDYSLSIR